MNMRNYIDRERIQPADFAGRIGVTVQALYKYMSGDRIPKKSVMQRIAQVSSGQVLPNDFFAPMLENASTELTSEAAA